MRNPLLVSLAAVREQEAAVASNSTVGGYHMDEHCDPGECLFSKAILEESDADRLYLLGDFARVTRGSCRIRDVQPTTFASDTVTRVNAFGRGRVDLRTTPGLLPVAVTADVERDSLVLIDGNHRTIWHWPTYATVAGVSIYVCEHPRMGEWLRRRGHPAGFRG